jgi:heme/copper-type cytochrome/quinol oxidase subunit 2
MRSRLALVAVAVMATSMLAGCGGSSETAGAGKTDVIKVSVKDGKVTPATHREKVNQGDTVRLEVTTDTDDEVHVHGIDIEKETVAGKPTRITFKADEPGVYEVETHETELQLMQLEVR